MRYVAISRLVMERKDILHRKCKQGYLVLEWLVQQITPIISWLFVSQVDLPGRAREDFGQKAGPLATELVLR